MNSWKHMDASPALLLLPELKFQAKYQDISSHIVDPVFIVLDQFYTTILYLHWTLETEITFCKKKLTSCLSVDYTHPSVYDWHVYVPHQNLWPCLALHPCSGCFCQTRWSVANWCCPLKCRSTIEQHVSVIVTSLILVMSALYVYQVRKKSSDNLILWNNWLLLYSGTPL